MHRISRLKLPLLIGLLAILLFARIAIAAELTSVDSFISPFVEQFGEVAIGRQVFVASNTILLADPDTRICIGNQTNLQDNILLIAQANRPAPIDACAPVSSSTGDRVSVAHQAIVKNSRLGNFTFVGFHARLENVVLQDGAFVLHGARVQNVTIGRNRLVPIAAVITTQAQADALPLKTEAIAQFQQDVLDVNTEFAQDYSNLFVAQGFLSVSGISAAPITSWNPQSVEPTLGANVVLDEFVRIVGAVRLGKDSIVGERTSIRADEGSPIEIGDRAQIGDRVTFHALKGTSIEIGDRLTADDNVVFHGPLAAGDDLTITDDAILFRSTVGSSVSIGARAIVVGVTLRDRAQVPADAVITTQEQADALRRI